MNKNTISSQFSLISPSNERSHPSGYSFLALSPERGVFSVNLLIMSVLWAQLWPLLRMRRKVRRYNVANYAEESLDRERRISSIILH